MGKRGTRGSSRREVVGEGLDREEGHGEEGHRKEGHGELRTVLRWGVEPTNSSAGR